MVQQLQSVPLAVPSPGGIVGSAVPQEGFPDEEIGLGSRLIHHSFLSVTSTTEPLGLNAVFSIPARVPSHF